MPGRPPRRDADPAYRLLEDPRINFAISTRGVRPGIDHLGLQADMTLLDEGETTCCYARSSKHWVTDPQGIAWEHFHALGAIPVFTEAVPAGEASGCCAASARGKPVGIPVVAGQPPSCC